MRTDKSDTEFSEIVPANILSLQIRDPHRTVNETDNVNVHRAAAKIIVSKSRAARGSVCNVLLSRQLSVRDRYDPRVRLSAKQFVVYC